MSIRKGNSVLASAPLIDAEPTQGSTSAVSSGGTYSAIQAVKASVEDIEALIPTQASASNQLADKAFVNSSLSTGTGSFIGTFNSVADLEAYSGTLVNGDYAFVVTTDQIGNTVYNRYKYTTATTPASWVFEYALNNSSFTANQWAAINSNATQELIAKISTNEQSINTHTANRSNPHEVTKAQIGLGNVDNTSDINKPVSTAVQNALDLKANTADLGTMAEESASDYTKTANLATVALSGDYDDLSNKPIIPAAQVNSDWDAASGVAQILNKPTLGTMAAENASDYTKTAALATVATSGDYTDLTNTPTIPTVNDATITITQGGVTKGSFTLNQATGDTIALDAGGGSSLPSQTGNAGKFLVTDGTDASWDTAISGTLTLNETANGGDLFVFNKQNAPFFKAAYYSFMSATNVTFSWGEALSQPLGTAYGISFSGGAITPTLSTQILGTSVYKWDNVYTTKISNGSSINIPNIAGTMAVQVASLPTADSALEGTMYQYIGATDSTYTNGYFYKCVSDGQEPATYSWERVDVQPGGGGLPNQTGNAGKFLTTDGTNASWATLPASGVLLEYKEFDHDPGISGWVKPTINDYYSASQYPETYNYLYNEWMTPNTSANYYAWTSGGMTIYTNTATPTTSDYWWEINTNPTSAIPVGMQTYLIVSGPGSVIDYVAADYSYIEDIMGAPYTRDSSKDIDAIRSFETETIAGITISYYNSVHGLKMVDMGSNIAGVYNATGDAWYYGIATYAAGTSFTLPVRKIRKLVRAGGDSSAWYRLYSDGWVEQGGVTWVSAAGQQIDLPITMDSASYTLTLGGEDVSGDANIVAFAYRTKNAGNFIVDDGYSGTFFPEYLNWSVSGQSTVTPKGSDYYFYVK